MKRLQTILLALGLMAGTSALVLHFYDPVRAPTWRLERVSQNHRATVRITTSQGNASGVVIGRNGIVLTAAHVATRGEIVNIEKKIGNQLYGSPAVVVISDKESQLAVLFTNATFPESVVFGRNSELRDGELVYTIGHPGRMTRPMVNSGIVSQRYYGLRGSSPRFSTVASLPTVPGMSGSPIFNSRGELVGIYDAMMGLNTLGPVGLMGFGVERWAVFSSTDPLAQVLQNFMESSNNPSVPVTRK